MSGHISLRRSIRWLPEPASEPTSTIVVTSPGNRFVDIRVLLPIDGTPTPADFKSEASLPLSRLDWAIAGISSSVETGPNSRHAKFAHWINSRTAHVEGVVDEGDMVPQTDGSELETGHMVNPATGVDTEYEEVWENVEIVKGTGTDVSVVLQFEGGDGERGMVVRLGQYCQGLMRVGEGVTAESWVWEESGWKRTVRFGEGELPCEFVVGRGREELQKGEHPVGGKVWKVVELS